MDRVAADLLREARLVGLAVFASGDRLVVRGPRSLAPLAERILAAKSDVLAALASDPDIAWRLVAMRRQLRPNEPVPFLCAVHHSVDSSKLCKSCGEPLPAYRAYRCDACLLAASMVIQDVVVQFTLSQPPREHPP